jgi:hypothetical protein
MKYRQIILFLGLTFLSYSNYGQQNLLDGLVKKYQDHQVKNLQEKIFMHLDRDFYVSGETMWFKIYLVDGYNHQFEDLSKVAYVEIIDRNKNVIESTKIRLESGKGNGSIALPVDIDSDNYTVRAYTNWMKNFSADFYFHQKISIVNVFQRLTILKPSAQALDIQFFSEGGQLIDGIKSKVAYRVVNSSGKGIDFEGFLLTHNGDTITKFVPLKFGIGSFVFIPRSDEEYKVVIKETSGHITSSKFLPVNRSGYSIMVKDTLSDYIKISIHSREEAPTPFIYLIAHARQIVKVATLQNLTNNSVNFLIKKETLGEGINHLTVFNHKIQPVCERLYFIKPLLNKSLNLVSDQSRYDTRSKIKLTAGVENTLKVNASLSVYKLDSLNKESSETISDYLLLTSDLKGTIESPDYYFSDDGDVNHAIDNLMLTHGWSRFKWEDVLSAGEQEKSFVPEARGHILTGQILDINSSKPVQGISGYLSSPSKYVQLYSSFSNEKGKVLFETFNLEGSKKLIAHTGNYQNTTHLEIESPYSDKYLDLKYPILSLPENVTKSLTERSLSMQVEDIFYRGRVKTITANHDSSAFYGIASESYLLDDYTRFPIMEEVLREYVKGVRLRKKDDQFIFKVLNAPKNQIFEEEPLVLLDGVPITNINSIMEMDPLKIKSLDVVTNRYYFGKFVFSGIVSFRTYKGDLAGYQFDPGTIVIDYEGLQSKKEFFSPKYETSVEKESRLPDQRNLLYWAPDVNISSQSVPIEFYSSDQNGEYEAVLQGMSSTGQPVYKKLRFHVKSVTP